MKTLRNIFIAISITLSFNSCLPEPIPIELDETESKLVISSQLIPEEIMIVIVTRSISALDYSQEDGAISSELLNEILVDGALVTITYDGIVDTLQEVVGIPGLYASASTPQIINTVYKLYVYDPATGDTVTSQAAMLRQITMDSVSAKREVLEETEKVIIDYSFTDPVDEENWYMINFISLNENAGEQTVNPFLEEEKILTESIFFSDKIIENGMYNGVEEIYYWTSDTIVVTISNISKEYFNFLNSSKRNDNFLSGLLNDPQTYPTNINGGYGFFITHFPDVHILEVKQEDGVVE